MRFILILIFSLFNLKTFALEQMTNVHYKKFNNDGVLESSMHASLINYDNEQILITKPKISQYNWELSAEHATTTSKPKIISFSDDVSITDRMDPSLSIKTQKLDYVINQNIFTNEDYVVFKKNNVVMSGYGLRANLSENKIKILNKVHTVLEVN